MSHRRKAQRLEITSTLSEGFTILGDTRESYYPIFTEGLNSFDSVKKTEIVVRPSSREDTFRFMPLMIQTKEKPATFERTAMLHSNLIFIYTTEYSDNPVLDIFRFFGFMAFVSILIILPIPVAIVLYILESRAIHVIVRNRSGGNPWAAWIPFARVFMRGRIADNITGKSCFRYILPVGKIMMFAMLGVVFGELLNLVDFSDGLLYCAVLLIMPVGLVVFVMEVIAAHYIFKKYHPRRAALFTVLSAIPLTAFLRKIFLFVIRNKQPDSDLPRSGPGEYDTPASGDLT